MKRLGMGVLFTVLFAASAAAQQAVFVVRHAERADGGTSPAGMTAPPDPDLSDTGRNRAQSLAVALKDAGITAIFVTEFRRTQQTAAPLAKALGLQPTIVAAKEIGTLVEKVKASTGNVLVVGHSNTVPEVIAGLGAGKTVKMTDNDFDNLFIVTRGDAPSLLRLHFR